MDFQEKVGKIQQMVDERKRKDEESKLRDNFAGLALQAIISNETLRQELANKCAEYTGEPEVNFVLSTYANMAYMLADAMMTVRSQDDKV